MVKKHNNVVLKADTPAEKFSWLTRLKAASVGPGAYMNAPLQRPPYQQSTLGPAPSKKAGGSQPQQVPHQQPQVRLQSAHGKIIDLSYSRLC